MLDCFTLIRPKTLLYIAAVQYIVYQTVLKTVAQVCGLAFLPDSPVVLLFIAATLFVSAGGFVLNDYFDVKTDRINRPKRVIVSGTVERGSALMVYYILTGIAVAAGAAAGILAGSRTTVFIFVVVPGILWFYSSTYKRQFLIGNLMLALLAALAVLSVAIIFVETLAKTYTDVIYQTPIPAECYRQAAVLAFFVFVCAFIGSIIKDLRNIDGDKEMECRTLAIKFGAKKSKTVLLTLILFIISASLIFGAQFANSSSLILKYIVILIDIPLLALIYMIMRAKTAENYAQALLLSKIIIFTGILYGAVFTFIMSVSNGFPIFGIFLVR